MNDPRSAPVGRGAAAPSTIDLVQALLHDLPGLVSDRVELFALELARAGSALAKIVALTVAVAILGITAWLALWAGVVMMLVELDLHWAMALALVILVNAAAVAIALMQVRRLARLLRLPATRRHLTAGAASRAALTAVPGTSSPPVSPLAEPTAHEPARHS